MCAKKVSDIDFDDLYSRGYSYALLDFDNTLAPDHYTEPIDYSYEMVDKMQKAGFSLCLVSNAKSDRSKKIADMHGWEIELRQPFGKYTKAFVISVPERT